MQTWFYKNYLLEIEIKKDRDKKIELINFALGKAMN